MFKGTVTPKRRDLMVQTPRTEQTLEEKILD